MIIKNAKAGDNMILEADAVEIVGLDVLEEMPVSIGSIVGADAETATVPRAYDFVVHGPLVSQDYMITYSKDQTILTISEDWGNMNEICVPEGCVRFEWVRNMAENLFLQQHGITITDDGTERIHAPLR